MPNVRLALTHSLMALRSARPETFPSSTAFSSLLNLSKMFAASTMRVPVLSCASVSAQLYSLAWYFFALFPLPRWDGDAAEGSASVSSSVELASETVAGDDDAEEDE